MAAQAVLTDPNLLRGVFVFQRGLPHALAEQLRAIRQRVRGSDGTATPLPDTPPNTLAFRAVHRGDLRQLQQIHRLKGEQDELARLPEFTFKHAWMEAVGAGHVEIAQWLDSQGLDLYSSRDEVLRRAIRSCDARMVAYVATRQNGLQRLEIKESHMVLVIQRNAVDVLKWLDGNVARVPYPRQPPVLAVTSSALEVLQYLHEKNYPHGWSTDVLDAAAATGKLDVVRFLHEHRTEGCTNKAMDKAAANGHLDVVVFLHEHRSEGCTTEALDSAAANNRVNVVRFLLAHRREGRTCAAIARALKNGHAGTVNALHEHSLRNRRGTTPLHIDEDAWERFKVLILRFMNGRAMERASADGDLAVVALLHLHCHDHCSPSACVEAADRGYADIVTVLVENCDKTAPLGQVLLAAVRSGDLETVTRVAERCEHHELLSARTIAVRRRLDRIVRYLSDLVASADA